MKRPLCLLTLICSLLNASGESTPREEVPEIPEPMVFDLMRPSDLAS
jgi:hypothetical protein